MRLKCFEKQNNNKNLSVNGAKKVVFNWEGTWPPRPPSPDLLLSFPEKSLSSDWTSSLINSSDVGHEFPGTALKSNNNI